MIEGSALNALPPRWLDCLRRSVLGRLLLFACVLIGLIGWLTLLNSPHLGINASIHWDSEASITYGPNVPDAAALQQARDHLYDAAALAGTDDPAEITRRYWQMDGSYHTPLTVTRFYYSLVSDFIGHQAFLLGKKYCRTPVGAILFYQFTALVMVAVPLALLLTVMVTRARSATAVGLSVITTLAVGSSPELLTLARQMLTETAGFFFLVPAVLTTMALIHRAEQRGARLLWSIAAGVLMFFTIRSRYTLGPSLILILLPLLMLEAARSPLRLSWRQAAGMFLPGAVAFSLLVVLDVHRFGALFMPWEYQQVLVRSSRLYFHSDPPYDDFAIALFLHLPLLIIGGLGIWFFVDQEANGPKSRAGIMAKTLVLAVVAVLIVMLWRTAAQQVKYQPRHLFGFSATVVVLAMLLLPRVRWRMSSAAAYLLIPGFFLVWNVCSSFGPQRGHTLHRQDDVVAVVRSHFSSDGARLKRSLFRDVWSSYFDWSDDRLLHDSLLAWTVLQHQGAGALVLIDDAAASANQFRFYATEFYSFEPAQIHSWSDLAAIASARTALQHGRVVYLFTAPGRRPPVGMLQSSPAADANLRTNALRRITAIAPSAVYLDCGVSTSATMDGLTIDRVHGQPGEFDTRYSYLPRVQREQMTFDADAAVVRYRISGLNAAKQYQLGYTSWDPDRLGRVMSVRAADSASGETTVLTPAGRITADNAASEAPLPVLVPLPRSGAEMTVEFRNESPRGGALVCEIWVFETAADFK